MHRRRILRFPRMFLAITAMMFGVPLIAVPVPKAQDAQQPMPDNTRKNKDQSDPTADQQKMNSADRTTTQKIRKAIHEDQSLSTYAHNVKIITRDGKVTLRGPVRSEDEKSSLQAKAVAVVGAENVTNQLEIMPPSK